MRSNRLLALVVVATAGLALTGCSSGNVDTAPPASGADSTTVAPAADAVTAPGTRLALDESAVVEVTQGTGGAVGLVRVTAAGITAATDAEAAELGPESRAEGVTPYLVRVEIEGVDEGSASLADYDMNGDFESMLPDGRGAYLLPIDDGWGACPAESFPGDFGPGASFTTCIPGFSDSTAPVTGLRYAPFEGPYSTVSGEPIIWE